MPIYRFARYKTSLRDDVSSIHHSYELLHLMILLYVLLASLQTSLTIYKYYKGTLKEKVFIGQMTIEL